MLPQHILYFGDAERDIQAAIAANMKSAVAAYGYLEFGSNAKAGMQTLLQTIQWNSLNSSTAVYNMVTSNQLSVYKTGS